MLASSSLEAALKYASCGWSLLPLHTPQVAPNGVRCSCGAPPKSCSIGKHPRTHHGHLDATTDPDKIRAWWQESPDANIGIATGARSGLVVIDVDPRHGGHYSLQDFEAQYGPLPDTLRVRSGGDDRGWHLYFRHPGRSVPSGTDVLGPGLDVLGDGGFIVAPPSLHESGRRYEIADEFAGYPDETPLADLPAAVLALMCEKKPTIPKRGTSIQEVSEYWSHRLLTSVEPDDLSRLFADPEVARACLAVLGFPADLPFGAATLCPLHTERRPSCAVMPPGESGRDFHVADFHAREGQATYSLTAWFYRRVTGTLMPRAAPTYLTWGVRLLVEAGVLKLPAIETPLLPGDAPSAARRVFQGFIELLGVRRLVSDREPPPFTWNFAARWCGITKREAGDGMTWLLGKRLLVVCGRFKTQLKKRMHLFCLGDARQRKQGRRAPTPPTYSAAVERQLQAEEAQAQQQAQWQAHKAAARAEREASRPPAPGLEAELARLAEKDAAHSSTEWTVGCVCAWCRILYAAAVKHLRRKYEALAPPAPP